MKFFQVKTLARTENPQTLIYQALHQDYSSEPVFDKSVFDETKCGQIAVSRLLEGDRGHYGVLEHPQITFNCCYFPHSVIQQGRTHRIGTSWDVQSFRYTGSHLCKVADGLLDPEQVFYLRPIGTYKDRQGRTYTYTEEQRQEDLERSRSACKNYKQRYDLNFSEEHLRGQVPFDYRQHFVVSFNMRSLMHFLDLRSKKDAQYEIQALCKLLLVEFKTWSPQIANWYTSKHKVKLAP